MQQEDGSLCEHLEKLFRRQSRQLFACALAVAGCPHQAEDAVQSAFCSLFKLTLRPQNLEAYVYRTVRNAALAQRRGRPVAELADEWFLFEPGAGPAELAEIGEFKQRAAAALKNLSDDERETVVAHLYGDMTFSQVAAVREISINTVTSWYRRGMDKLRQELGESQ
jgi:RNA polymerase sigma factor (sigma-70 family)